MRMIRDSPPELERLLPGPYASRSVTRRPARASQWAVHAPKHPAPTTTTRDWEVNVLLAILVSLAHRSRASLPAGFAVPFGEAVTHVAAQMARLCRGFCRGDLSGFTCSACSGCTDSGRRRRGVVLDAVAWA